MKRTQIGMHVMYVVAMSTLGCTRIEKYWEEKNISHDTTISDTGLVEDVVDDTVLDDTASINTEVSECLSTTRQVEGTFVPQSGTVLGHRDPCSQAWHASAGAKDSMLAISMEVWDGETNPKIRMENLLGEPLVDWRVVEVHEPIYISLHQSGEFFIVVDDSGSVEKSNNYRLAVDCIAGCSLEYTRYPLFFMHGLAGFDSLLNVMDYWLGVDELLTNTGYHVEIHGVPAFDTTYVRTGYWQEYLQELVDTGVGRKFNLIGHSQGGLDARYFASVLDTENRVASITTIATPHTGSSVAELLSMGMDISPDNGALIDAMVNWGSELFGTTGESFSGQLAQMSPDAMELFNQEVPDVRGVQYFSWAGKSCRYTQFACQVQQQGETVSSYFLLSHAYMELREGDNDGLVSTTSAQWGEFLGILPADHMDEVGHRFDLSSQPFDAAQFYLEEARRLSDLGL